MFSDKNVRRGMNVKSQTPETRVAGKGFANAQCSSTTLMSILIL